MTVKELIEELQKVEDKSKVVYDVYQDKDSRVEEYDTYVVIIYD